VNEGVLVNQSILLTIVFICVSACSVFGPKADDPAFNELTQSFLSQHWNLHPGWASRKGLSQYDPILAIPDASSRSQRLDFYKTQLDLFEAIDPSQLSVNQATDRSLILNQLQRSIWSIETFKEYQWNPAMYNIAGSVSAVLEKKQRPLEDRLLDISRKLEKVSLYYQEAQKQIHRPTREHLDLALKQSKGTVTYLKNTLRPQVAPSQLSAGDKKILEQRIVSAEKATKSYIKFLQSVLARPQMVGGWRDFRIGSELYAQKFNFDLQIDMTPEELYQKALAAKKEARSKMFELAIELYPKYFGEKLPPKSRQQVIESVLDKVSQNHPQADQFVESVREQIPQLIQFIQDKDLLTLDASRPLQVRETPVYQRGFAIASVDAPGPFDPERETFYNVLPLDGMTAAQKKSHLREYNNYMMQILNIHEAVPGHYVQLVYSNKSPSIIKSIFGNTPMIEGWAVYTERMMLEEGYGDNNPELWLVYYKWFLRAVTNTILDYEIHNKNLSRALALKLMKKGAFQENAEAEAKWVRATLSQIQLLSYFAGFTEIYNLREELKEKQGSSFDLKKFHESFLSFGSSPVREIRKQML
jgi:uncharacterized protein (DUF885 family)